MVSLHIYQQLYKNLQKLDPFSGSCRVQLVTRDLALQEALNSSHVALPVHCGFGDFIRVGQLLPLVRLCKDREGSGGRGPGGGGGSTVKVALLIVGAFGHPFLRFW